MIALYYLPTYLIVTHYYQSIKTPLNHIIVDSVGTFFAQSRDYTYFVPKLLHLSYNWQYEWT